MYSNVDSILALPKRKAQKLKISDGLLKLLVINEAGIFIGGLKISDVNIEALNLQAEKSIRFRTRVKEDANHVGGLTVFGKAFGNHDQDIRVSLNCAPIA